MAYATIDGFEDLTAQQVFDISKNHLLQQNQKSMALHDLSLKPICAYRGEMNRMCAAGPFIKEKDAYKCENKDWSDLNTCRLVPNIHYDLMCELQKVHDLTEPSVWPEKLAAVAAKYHLVY